MTIDQVKIICTVPNPCPLHCTTITYYIQKQTQKHTWHAAHSREEKEQINIRNKRKVRVRVRWSAIRAGLPTHFGTQRMSRVYLRWYLVPEAHRWSPRVGWGSAGGESHRNPPPQRKRRPRPHQPPPPPSHPHTPETTALLKTDYNIEI